MCVTAHRKIYVATLPRMNDKLSKFLNESLFIIVLYERHADQSEAYVSLTTMVREANIFLYDNSRTSSPMQAEGTHYFHSGSNEGVSHAYNQGYKFALKHHFKWLILFDQDTTVTIHYLESVSSSIGENPDHTVFVPKIEDKNGLLSPFRWSGVRGQRIASPLTKMPLAQYRFINSGLVILADTFGSVQGYDESIPLDFSDIFFGERLQKVEPYFIVLSTILKSSFSATERIDLSSALIRYQKYSQAAKEMGVRSQRTFAFAWYAGLRAMKLCYQYKTMDFIGIFLRRVS